MSDLDNYLRQSNQRVNQALELQVGSFTSVFAPQTDSSKYLHRLEEAIRYSLLNGGKRIRPMLVYAAADAIAGKQSDNPALDIAACAIEMIHAYSLVHDDLPAMDDDDLRRGQPSCHRAFDEATAILVGDALQSRAFELLSEISTCDDATKLALINNLAKASGPVGMVGGQAIDLAAVARDIDIEELETLHRLKTGALIRAAVKSGALIAGANQQQLQDLDNFAEAIGLAFQVQDDILDIEGETNTLGKPQGADKAMNKPTYPSLIGLEAAKEKASTLHYQALTALGKFRRWRWTITGSGNVYHYKNPLKQHQQGILIDKLQ